MCYLIIVHVIFILRTDLQKNSLWLKLVPCKNKINWTELNWTELNDVKAIQLLNRFIHKQIQVYLIEQVNKQAL